VTGQLLTIYVRFLINLHRLVVHPYLVYRLPLLVASCPTRKVRAPLWQTLDLPLPNVELNVA